MGMFVFLTIEMICLHLILKKIVCKGQEIVQFLSLLFYDGVPDYPHSWHQVPQSTSLCVCMTLFFTGNKLVEKNMRQVMTGG